MPTLKNKTKRMPWKGKREAFGRRKESNQRFYNSRKWRKVRALYISQNPLCVECERRELVEAAAVVDHKTAINQGGAKYDFENLQSLCHSCHNRKSGREAHQDK